MGEAYQQSEPMRDLPDKEGRRHRWIVIATHVASDDVVKRSFRDGEGIILDNESLWDITIGCIDCEEIYEIAKSRPCHAPEYKP